MSNDESGPSHPELVGEDVNDAASAPIEDLAWAVPTWSMWPLALAVSALLTWSFGTDRVLVSLIPLGVLLSIITVIDLRELRVPNRLLAPAYVAAPVLLAIASTSPSFELSLVRAVLGGLVLFALYFLILFVYPPGMGWGDVKLAPLLGAQLGLFGWVEVARGVILAHLVGGVAAIAILGVGLVRRGRLGHRIAFPFAPFLAIGTILALIVQGGGV